MDNQELNLKEIKLRIEAIERCTEEMSNLQDELEEINLERHKHLLALEALPVQEFKLGNWIYTIKKSCWNNSLNCQEGPKLRKREIIVLDEA